MNLKNRLKKLEIKRSFKSKIMVVKFGSELFCLSHGDEEFHRIEGETEEGFIKRIKALVAERPDRPLVTILVGNF